MTLFTAIAHTTKVPTQGTGKVTNLPVLRHVPSIRNLDHTTCYPRVTPNRPIQEVKNSARVGQMQTSRPDRTNEGSTQFAKSILVNNRGPNTMQGSRYMHSPKQAKPSKEIQG